MRAEVPSTVRKYLLTIEEAAQSLSVGRTHFYKLLSTQAIYTVRIGRCRLVPVGELEAFIARQMEKQGGRHG
jgi:excisionase family DNA binding protein